MKSSHYCVVLKGTKYISSADYHYVTATYRPADTLDFMSIDFSYRYLQSHVDAAELAAWCQAP
jgi:hypothetical protein